MSFPAKGSCPACSSDLLLSPKKCPGHLSPPWHLRAPSLVAAQPEMSPWAGLQDTFRIRETVGFAQISEEGQRLSWGCGMWVWFLTLAALERIPFPVSFTTYNLQTCGFGPGPRRHSWVLCEPWC